MDVDLMILFNGFIKNYSNLCLNINTENIDKINKENKYFITVGKLLGFSVISKKTYEGNIDIYWKEADDNTFYNSKTKLTIIREVDLTKDLLAIHKLINIVKPIPDNNYVLILPVSSFNRIDFLNNIIKSSLKIDKYEILTIYIVKDLINNIFYFNAYLFKNGEIIKNRVGISYKDNDEKLIATFKS